MNMTEPVKGVRVQVLRLATVSDASNGGLTSQFAELTVTEGYDAVKCEDFAIPGRHRVTENAPAVRLIKSQLSGLEYWFIQPLELPGPGCVGWVSGGNFAHDSGLYSIIGHTGAVRVHDRKE